MKIDLDTHGALRRQKAARMVHTRTVNRLRMYEHDLFPERGEWVPFASGGRQWKYERRADDWELIARADEKLTDREILAISGCGQAALRYIRRQASSERGASVLDRLFGYRGKGWRVYDS